MGQLGGPEIVVIGAIAVLMFAIPVAICAALFTAFRRVPERHRQLDPGLVWLLLIPCFNCVWNFFVYLRLSRSLSSAYRAGGRTDVGDCGYGIGLAYCICVAIALVPYAGCLTLPAAFVLLIIYLVKVLGLSRGIPAQAEGSESLPAPAPPQGSNAAIVAVVVVVAGLAFVAMFGIIAAIAIPNFLNAVDRGKQKRTMIDIRSIATAIEAYRVDENALPVASDAEALEGRLTPVYIKNMPKLDGWGRPIAVEVREDGYLLHSTGKDGVADGCAPGETDSFDADICFADGQFVRYPAGVQH